METQLERISPVECRVRVEIAWDDVSPRLEKKMRDARRRARLPGFRVGKVPTHVIERLYGAGVREELAYEMVGETFPSAVAEHKTVALTEPAVEEHSLEKGTTFRYAARFEVSPAIEPKDYKGVEVRRRPAVVADGGVDERLKAKQEELAEIRPIPEDIGREDTAEGDIWTFDLDGTFAGQPVSRKDSQIEIGGDAGQVLPGLAGEIAKFKLADVGSSKTVNFTPPQDGLKPEFADKPVELTLGLREVKQKVRPQLDDEFARDTGDAESFEELKTKIEDSLREEDGMVAERDARQRLVKKLLELNPFDPAPSMISREVAGQVDRIKGQLRQQDMTLANLNMNEGQLAQQVRGEAVFNVTAFLLLDAIGKAESIDVSDEELTSEIEEIATERNQNVAKVRASMEKSQEILLLRAQIRESKILDFLMGEAKVTEAPDPVEDDAVASDDAAPAAAETD